MSILQHTLPESQDDASPDGATISPRKRLLLDKIRSATAQDECPVLAEIRSELPESFPQPSPEDVRLFHLAVRENCRRLVDKLLPQYPTLVLHRHYDEAPLIAAIRCGWEDLAIFLVEHGASVQCSKLLFDSASGARCQASWDWYEVSAREMAYERRMLRLLEIVDYLTGNYFPYLRPPDISIRMLRPVKPGASESSEDLPEIPEDFFTDTYLKPGEKLQVARSSKSSPNRRSKQPKQQTPHEQQSQPKGAAKRLKSKQKD